MRLRTLSERKEGHLHNSFLFVCAPGHFCLAFVAMRLRFLCRTIWGHFCYRIFPSVCESGHVCLRFVVMHLHTLSKTIGSHFGIAEISLCLCEPGHFCLTFVVMGFCVLCKTIRGDFCITQIFYAFVYEDTLLNVCCSPCAYPV